MMLIFETLTGQVDRAGSFSLLISFGFFICTRFATLECLRSSGYVSCRTEHLVYVDRFLY